MSNMKNLREIRNIINTSWASIPDIQRNYKWAPECAKRLCNNLLDAYRDNPNKLYPLGMLVINKREECIEIIDGQQRLITLTLILRAVISGTTGTGSTYTSPPINIRFNRDNNSDGLVNRWDLLLNPLEKTKDGERDTIDTIRIRNNFRAIVSTKRVVECNGIQQLEDDYNYRFPIDQEERKGFLNFLLNKVVFLWNPILDSPIKEFLNINKNKTRFSVSDFMRSYFVINNEVSTKKITYLLEQISELLYLKETGLSSFITSYTKGNKVIGEESRLNILYADSPTFTTVDAEFVVEPNMVEELLRIKNCLILIKAMSSRRETVEEEVLANLCRCYLTHVKSARLLAITYELDGELNIKKLYKIIKELLPSNRKLEVDTALVTREKYKFYSISKTEDEIIE